MEDIYEATNLSPGAVYNYFHNKEEIVRAAVKQGQQQTSEAIKSLAAQSSNGLGKVIHLFLSTIKDNDSLKSANANLELFAKAGRTHQIAEPMRKNMDAILSQIDALAVARVLISMYYGLTIQRVLHLSMDVDAYISVCDAVIEGSFQGKGRKDNTQ